MARGVAIQIWSRLTLPERYKFILERFETIDDLDPYDPEKIEEVSFVVHIPAQMLQDRIVNFHFDLARLREDRQYCYDRLSSPIHELIGTNALDLVEDPEGDGVLLVCSSV